MATKEKVIFTDGAEIILLLPGRAGRESHIFQAEEISNVRFGYTQGLLEKIMKKVSRSVYVTIKGLGSVEFSEKKHKANFDGYIDDLRAYCKKNHVTFQDFPDAK